MENQTMNAPTSNATPSASANTSGQGKMATVPPEVSGWNWGAFLLGWIWGIGNNVYIALLTFVPMVNLVMFFMLGAKGGAWAWQNKKWASVEHFKQTQKKWAIAGLVVLIVSLVFGFLNASMSAES